MTQYQYAHQLRQENIKPIYVQKNGKQYGPYQYNELSHYYRTGQFLSSDLFWSDGMTVPEPLASLMNPDTSGDKSRANPVAVLEKFGFHPTVAAFTVIIDLVIFGGTVLTLGFGWIFFVTLALALGYIAYTGQKSWYGDTEEDARTKAVMVAVLTGIPLPIATALMLYSKLTGGIKNQKQD